MRVRWGIGSLVLGFLLISDSGAPAQVPEPEGYRLDDYRAPTPATVPGAVTVGTEAAYRLWQSGAVVWVDVLPAPRRPENFPPQALWMPMPRRHIPGSLWLPDVGRGSLGPELEAYFRTHLEAATEGLRDRPIAFYCLAQCWMSWNAVKRAVSWGYSHLYWYRDGIDGWEAAELPTEDAEPVPGP